MINIDGITVKDCIYFMLIILGILLGNIMSSYSYEIKNDSNKSEALKSFIKKDTLFIEIISLFLYLNKYRKFYNSYHLIYLCSTL